MVDPLTAHPVTSAHSEHASTRAPKVNTTREVSVSTP
jgi:hypothetical protein